MGSHQLIFGNAKELGQKNIHLEPLDLVDKTFMISVNLKNEGIHAQFSHPAVGGGQRIFFLVAAT